MSTELKVYKCSICGHVIEVLNNGTRLAAAKTICCGKEMDLLAPNTVEASTEKHLPVATFVDENKISVKVGSAEHPMLEAHYIEWISVVYGDVIQRVNLKPGQAPEAIFCICDATDIDIYAYCNLHGLWKANVAK